MSTPDVLLAHLEVERQELAAREQRLTELVAADDVPRFVVTDARADLAVQEAICRELADTYTQATRAVA